jgi:capsid protein
MTPAKKKEFKVSRVDRALLSVFPTYGMRRLYARHTADQLSAYRSSSTNRLRKNWAMGDAEADPAAHERGRLVERSRDANRNDPVASGATDTLGHNIVGTGLRPQSALRPELLGISEKRAKVIRTQIESAFERFSAMSDAANILSFDEQQFLALRKNHRRWGSPCHSDVGQRTVATVRPVYRVDRGASVDVTAPGRGFCG